MKVQGSGLSKLFATKIEQKPVDRPKEATKGDSAQAVETSIRGSVSKNLEAASTISRVAQALPTRESGPARTSKNNVQGDADVARANRSSSETSVEDVDRFAEKLAESIVTNPEQALEAQRAPASEKVQSLLR